MKHESGLALRPRGIMHDLPIEFWNHELLDVNPKNKKECIEFVEAWGIPYHPYRNSVNLPLSLRKKLGIAATDKMQFAFTPQPKPEQIRNEIFYIEDTSPYMPYISFQELENSLLMLRTIVMQTVYGMGGFGFQKDILILNSAACNSYELQNLGHETGLFMDYEGYGLRARGLLTSAICNQLIQSFADDAEWRVCACEDCERVFKRRRPSKPSVRPDRDSKYCCVTCKNRQSQRNKRAAAKNRIQH